MENDAQSAIDCSSRSRGMPAWFVKSHSRYDDDQDIQFSLPSGDDGFFSLHFGGNDDTVADDASPHKSTFDRINEELGFSKAGLGLSVSPGTSNALCLTEELQRYTLLEEVENSYPKPTNLANFPTRKEVARVAPKLVVECDGEVKDALIPQSTDPIADKSEDNKVDLELAANLQRRLSDVAENQNLGILTKVKNYFLKTEPSSPLHVTPHSSPKLLRKTSTPIGPIDINALNVNQQQEPNTKSYSTGGVVAERKMNYNAYFYRPETDLKKEKSSVGMKLTDDSGSKKTASAGNTAAAQARQYKPKPSQLREMNFWAPTSM